MIPFRKNHGLIDERLPGMQGRPSAASDTAISYRDTTT